MTTMTYAAKRSERLTAWLWREGDSIFLSLPGSEDLRFGGPGSGSAETTHWDALDQILRSTGK